MTGRPTKYTEELAGDICTRLAGGESLRSICRGDGMPTISTVLLWVVRDREGFSEQYMRAQEAQGASDADKTHEVYAMVESGEIKPDQARVMFDILRWSAERRAPKRYGQKQQIDHSSPDGSMSPKSAIDPTQLSTQALKEIVNARGSTKDS